MYLFLEKQDVMLPKREKHNNDTEGTNLVNLNRYYKNIANPIIVHLI